MTFVIFSLIALLELVIPLMVGYMILHSAIEFKIIYPGEHISHQITMTQCLSLLLLMSISIGLLNIVKIRLLTRFEILMIEKIQYRVFQKLFKLTLQFFDQHAVGDLSHKVLLSKSMTQPFNQGYIGSVLSFLFSFVSFSMMLFYAWKLTLLILLTMMIFLLVTSWILGQTLSYQASHTDKMGESYGFIFQVIHGLIRIKLFAKEDLVEKKWSKIDDEAKIYAQHVHHLGVWRFTLFSSMQMTLVFIMFVLAQYLYPNFPLDYLIIYSMALTQFVSRILPFYASLNELLPSMIAYRQIKPMMLSHNEKILTDTEIQLDGSIVIKDLFFKYPTSKVQVFNGLNFTVFSGEHIAIVGMSGAGKSTLIKLLLGFYFAEKGDIYFNEQSIETLNLKALRKQIGVVFQDSQLLNGSILENIISHTGASEEEAYRVAEMVGLREWLDSLPMGINTYVTQHISTISGGQKQLLLIARALIHRPKLLILDEATSFLDNATQRMISDRINQLKITRISIAHRLSTITQADKILVIDHGRIIEQGCYQSLLDQKGLFYKFARLQTGLSQVTPEHPQFVFE